MFPKIAFLFLCFLLPHIAQTQALPQDLNEFFALASERKKQTFLLLHQQTAQTITARQGSRIRLPALAFVRNDAKPIRLPISLQVREAYTWGDMIAQNITTTYRQQLHALQTTGAIYIEARDATQAPLQLAANKLITIEFPQPSSAMPRNMRLFRGKRENKNPSSTLHWHETQTKFEIPNLPADAPNEDSLWVKNTLLLLNPNNKKIAPYRSNDLISRIEQLKTDYPQPAAENTSEYENQADAYSYFLKGLWNTFFKRFSTNTADTLYFSYRSWQEDVLDAAAKFSRFSTLKNVEIIAPKDLYRAAFAPLLKEQNALNKDIADIRQFCQTPAFISLVNEVKDSFQIEKWFPFVLLKGYHSEDWGSIDMQIERWREAAPDSASFTICMHRFIRSVGGDLREIFDNPKHSLWAQRLQDLDYMQRLRIASQLANRQTAIFHNYRQQKALLGELAGNYYAVAQSDTLGWLGCMSASKIPAGSNKFSGVYFFSPDTNGFVQIFILKPTIGSVEPLQHDYSFFTMYDAPDLPIKIIFLLVKNEKISLHIKECNLKNPSFEPHELREYSLEEALRLLSNL